MVYLYYILSVLTLVVGTRGVLGCTVGTIDCVKAGNYYESYQYAICVAKSTLDTIGPGIICNNKHCWLPCTLISEGQSSGQVPKQCRCDQNLKVTSRAMELDISCYIPKGDNCDWYERCLETRIPCDSGDENARYALKYAKYYCDRYSQNYHKFSEKGKRWIDATRGCLQKKLVPYLLTKDKPTCSELKTKAFESHFPCYVMPDKEAPSVCDLFSDFTNILNTIGKSFIKELFLTVKSSFQTLRHCIWNIISQKNSITGNQIANEARMYINSTLWLYQTQKDPLKANTNKCNLFVADVLKAVGIKAPSRYWILYRPIGANEWANPVSSYLEKEKCWSLCSEPMQRGDVIAMNGHVGIITGVNVSTSASALATPRGKIVENDWGFRPTEMKPTCWRYRACKR